MQNAVDAVRELAVWSKSHKKKMSSRHLPKLAEGADVLIDFVDQGDGKWLLKVQDRGIGMTADILQKYFLRAGASFRQSPEWTKQFTDCDGNTKVLRSGKFGIGTFAAFLLGPEFKLTTRHACEDGGHTIEAKMDSRLIEIRPDSSAKIGTTVEVLLREEAITALKLKALHADNSHHWMSDWYCQEEPKVVRRIGAGKKFRVLKTGFSKEPTKAESGWMTISPIGYKAVHWTPNYYPTLTCNGIRIASPAGENLRDAEIEWPYHQTLLNRPNIAVDDTDNYLPITTQRYGLLTSKLPFLEELTRDVMLSFIAHTLILGPRNRTEALSYTNDCNTFPLIDEQKQKGRYREYEKTFLNRWITTEESFVPFDPYLLNMLGSKNLVICEVETEDYWEEKSFASYDKSISNALSHVQCAALKWDGSLDGHKRYREPGSWMSARYPNILRERPERDWLLSEAAQTLGRLPEIFEIIVSGQNKSLERYINQREQKGMEWKPIGQGQKDESPCFITKKGNIELPVNLFDFSTNLSEAIAKIEGIKRKEHFGMATCVMALQIPEDAKQEFPIAKVWNEILGYQAVPFEPHARQQLIERGRTHPDLKRHVKQWEMWKAKSGAPARP